MSLTNHNRWFDCVTAYYIKNSISVTEMQKLNTNSYNKVSKQLCNHDRNIAYSVELATYI